MLIGHLSRCRDRPRLPCPASRDEFCGVRRSYCRTRYRGGLLMRSVTYSMGVSLDGYIVGPDGGFGWTAPDEEVFRLVTDEIRQSASTCWDDGCTRRCCTGRPPTRIQRSTTQCSSGPRSGSRSRRWCSPPRCRRCRAMPAWPPALGEEIERLRAEPAEDSIAIGGAALAAEAAALGLIDEYPARVYPVLVGGGIPFFPQREGRVDLDSSRPAPSARESSTSATAWRASRLVRRVLAPRQAMFSRPTIRPSRAVRREVAECGELASYAAGNGMTQSSVLRLTSR